MTRILQLTDLHVFAQADQTLQGVPTRSTLRAVVDQILASETEFDQVVVTGDHTHDELPESYQAVADILSPWHDRLWQVPGNHDDRIEMRRAFARIGGEGQAPIGFQFTVGEWSCIGLDSHIPGEVAGQIQDVQLELLRHQLSECSSARVALFLHHPPVNVNSEWMDAIGLKNKDALQDIVRGDNRIRLICCGHVHHEFEGSIDQATVLATPSTGLQFDPIGSSPTFCNDPPGYRIIEFNDVDFTTTVVRVPVDG